jgi:hypothetical protein
MNDENMYRYRRLLAILRGTHPGKDAILLELVHEDNRNSLR